MRSSTLISAGILVVGVLAYFTLNARSTVENIPRTHFSRDEDPSPSQQESIELAQADPPQRAPESHLPENPPERLATPWVHELNDLDMSGLGASDVLAIYWGSRWP